MDWLFHVLGLCPDSFSHPNLLTILFGFGLGWVAHIKGWLHLKREKCDCGCHKDEKSK